MIGLRVRRKIFVSHATLPNKKNFKKDDKAVAAPGKPDAGKKKKNGPKPETECFYCKGKGHWQRNCPKYLADKKAGSVKGVGERRMGNKNFATRTKTYHGDVHLREGMSDLRTLVDRTT